MKSFLIKSACSSLYVSLLIMLLCSQAYRIEDPVSANLKFLATVVDEYDYCNQRSTPENFKQKSDIQSDSFNDAVGQIQDGNVSEGLSKLLESEAGYYSDGSYSEDVDHVAHELWTWRVWLFDWFATTAMVTGPAKLAVRILIGWIVVSTLFFVLVKPDTQIAQDLSLIHI